MKTTKVTYYRICDAAHPMYHSENFNTVEEAENAIKIHYKNNENKYWRDRPQNIEKVTTVVKIIKTI